MSDDKFPPSILPEIVDRRAIETPEKVWCKYLPDDWRETGPRSITYSQASRAVHRLCWWLEKELGPSRDFDSFVYIGPNDVRYSLLIIAAQRCQRVLVITELNRLTPKALLLLLDEMKCFTWIGGSPEKVAEGADLPSQREGTRLLQLPPLEFWLDDGTVEPYPFSASWEEVKTNPVFCIHSSGTTGIPKKLVYTGEMISLVNWFPELPDGSLENEHLAYRQTFGKYLLWCAPPQWLGGIIGQIEFTLFHEACVLWPPACEVAPTPTDVVVEILEKLESEKLDGGFWVPSTLKEMCLDEHSRELLTKHRIVVSGGAPLDTWVGEIIASRMTLVPLIGATEQNHYPIHKIEDPVDWQYYHFDKRMNYRMEPFSSEDGDDIYEMFIERRPEWRRYQGAFVMFPDLNEYCTQDLYSQHPTKPHLWRHRGRADDLVKLRWLTKIRASDVEGELDRHPNIASAMVGGEGRDSPFVIIQLKDATSTSEKDGLSNEVWQIMKALNEKISAEIEIPRENIIIAHPDKPLKKLGKGTLNRRVINMDYEKEIEALYRVHENSNGHASK